MFPKKDKSSQKSDMSFKDHKNTAPKTPTASCDPPPAPTTSSGLGQTSKVSKTLLPVPSASSFPASRNPSGSNTPKRGDESPVTSSPRPLATPSNGSELIVPSESSKSDRNRLKKPSIPSFRRATTSSGRDIPNVATTPSLGSPSSNDMMSLGRNIPMNVVPPIMTYVTDLTSAYDDASMSNPQNTPKVAQAPSLRSVAGRHPGNTLPLLMRTPSGRFNPSTFSNLANLDAGDYGRRPPLPSRHTPRDNVPPSSIARPVARSAGRIKVRDGDLTAEDLFYTPRPTPTPSRPQTPHPSIARDNEPTPDNHAQPVAESAVGVKTKSDDATSKAFVTTSIGRVIPRPSRPQIPSRNIARDNASTPGTVVESDIRVKAKSEDAIPEGFVTTSLGRVIPRPSRPQIPSRNIARDNEATPGTVVESAMRVKAKSEDAIPEGFMTTSLGRVIPCPSRPQIPSRNIARDNESIPGTVAESAIRVKVNSEDAIPEGFMTTSLGRVIPCPSRPQTPYPNIARDNSSNPDNHAKPVGESAIRGKAKSDDATPKGFVTTSLGRIIPCPSSHDTANSDSRKVKNIVSPPSKSDFTTRNLETPTSRRGPRASRSPVRHLSPTTSSSQSLPYYSDRATPNKGKGRLVGDVFSDPSQEAVPNESAEFSTQGPKTQEPKASPKREDKRERKNSPPLILEVIPSQHTFDANAPPPGLYTVSELLNLLVDKNITYTNDGDPVPISVGDWKVRVAGIEGHNGRIPIPSTKALTNRILIDTSIKFVKAAQAKAKAAREERNRARQQNLSTVHPGGNASSVGQTISSLRKVEFQAERVKEHRAEIVYPDQKLHPAVQTTSALEKAEDEVEHTREGNLDVFHPYKRPHPVGQRILALNKAEDEAERTKEQNLNTVHPDGKLSSVKQRILALKKAEDEAERTREHYPDVIYPDRRLRHVGQKISTLTKVEDEAERVKEQSLEFVHPDNTLHPVGQKISAYKKAEDGSRRAKEQSLEFVHPNQKLRHVGQHISVLKELEDEAERAKKEPSLTFIHPDGTPFSIRQKILALKQAKDEAERAKGPSGRKKLLVRDSYVNFDGSVMSDEQMEVLWDEVEKEKKANGRKLAVFGNIASVNNDSQTSVSGNTTVESTNQRKIKNIELQATLARIRVNSDQTGAEAFEELKDIVKRIKAAKSTAVAKAALLNPTHEFLDMPAKIMLCIMRELLVVAPEEEVVPYHYVAGKVIKNADGGRWGLRNKPQVNILVALCATQDKRVKSALDTGRNVLYRENQFAFRKPDELILFIDTIGAINLARMDFHTNLVVSIDFLTKYTQSLEVKWLALWQENLKSVMRGRELTTPDWKPQDFDDEYQPDEFEEALSTIVDILKESKEVGTPRIRTLDFGDEFSSIVGMLQNMGMDHDLNINSKVEAETAAAPHPQFDWTEWKLDRASGGEDYFVSFSRAEDRGARSESDMFVQGDDLYEVSEYGGEEEEDDETSIASENDTLDREIKELIAAAGAA